MYLVSKSVAPDILHVIPVCNNDTLHRLFQGQDTSIVLGLITHIVLLAHAQYHTMVQQEFHDGGEDGLVSIINYKSVFHMVDLLLSNSSLAN